MNKLFYPKLAGQNIIKNGKFYFPYLLTVVISAAAFYIMTALSYYNDLPGKQRYDYLMMFMTLGSFVLALFIVIFLSYTNSFLMKRRSKELGLYNILGMGKSSIGLVLCCESLYTWLCSVVIGIPLGMLLQKLVMMLVGRIMRFDTMFEFYVSGKAIGLTAAAFAGVIAVSLLCNLKRLHFQRPVELLHGQNTGEREPKSKWLLAVIGVLTLGAGYYLAIETKDAMSAITIYFIAVVLVIIGTYCLFSAVSIVILKALRKNKRFYYKTSNFIGVSGMLHRMNRNAVGLANICILSTMVLVMISATLSLYLGTEEAIQMRYPADLIGIFKYSVDEKFDTETISDGMTKVIRAHGLEPTRVWSYSTLPLWMTDNGSELTNATGERQARIVMLTSADYEALSGKKLTLDKDEVMYVGGDTRYDKLTLSIFDDDGNVERCEFKTVEPDSDFEIGEYVVMLIDIRYLIFPDMAVLHDVWQLIENTYGGERSALKMDCSVCIDADGTEEQKRECGAALSDWDTISSNIDGDIEWDLYYVNEKTENAEEFYSMNGAFLFLGVFLGIIFMMAMVLIIYYKQISEGYEDRERYRIMQQVGLQKEEVRSSINKQVLIVFFAPLIVSGIHVAFDFSLIKLMLQLFRLMNAQLAMWCTVGSFAGFAVIYALVYMRTAKVYYKLVSK